MDNQEKYRDWQDVLKEILNKPIDNLTQMEIAFLRARQSYLSPVEKDKYSHLLNNNKTSKKTSGLKEYWEIVKEAKKLGVDIKGKTKEQLKEILKL